MSNLYIKGEGKLCISCRHRHCLNHDKLCDTCAVNAALALAPDETFEGFLDRLENEVDRAYKAGETVPLEFDEHGNMIDGDEPPLPFSDPAAFDGDDNWVSF